MPTVHQHGIVFAPSNDFLNLRRIEPAKSSVTWRIGYVLQEAIRVSFKQGYIPIEFHAEPSASMFPRCRLVAVIDAKVQFRTGSHGPKPYRVILDGVGADDSQFRSLLRHSTT